MSFFKQVALGHHPWSSCCCGYLSRGDEVRQPWTLRPRRRSDAVRNAVGVAFARGMFLFPAISSKEQTVDQLEEQAVECIVRSDMTHIDPMVVMAQAMHFLLQCPFDMFEAPKVSTMSHLIG